MSFSTQEEVSCPCGETFEAVLWNSVNLAQDPELRSLLLGGALNVYECSMCKGLVYTERFVLVHDPATELLAFVHPKAREPERLLLEASMHRDTAQAQAVEGGIKIAYPGTLLFGMENLVALVEKEEEEAVQGAVLKASAEEVGVDVASLKPFVAREAGLPARLPMLGAGTAAERLRRGLKALLSANDRLTVYAALLSRLEGGGISEEALSAIP